LNILKNYPVDIDAVLPEKEQQEEELSEAIIARNEMK
jgi:hypothetical protein